MEKALETIKKHIKDLERMEDVFTFYGCFNSASECKKATKELTEAIEELEEAMKHKTCVGCEYVIKYPNGCHECCLLTYADQEGCTSCIEVDKDFYCNKYKPKDTQC